MTAQVWLLLSLAGLLLATGIYLLATSRPARPSLTDRLRPYHVRSVSDEAREWLREQ